MTIHLAVVIGDEITNKVTIRWCSSKLQGIQTRISRTVALKGLERYHKCTAQKTYVNWTKLKSASPDPTLQGFELDEMDEYELDSPDSSEHFDVSLPQEVINGELERLEMLDNINWNLDGYMEVPERKYAGKSYVLDPAAFTTPMKSFLRYDSVASMLGYFVLLPLLAMRH